MDVGWLPFGHLYSKNAERPNIYFSVVLFLASDHFRRHPADCADFALTLDLLDSELASVAEIRELYFAI